ncbi:MAG: diguanylate cyclase [Selenomonadaceae bacterium]|nr:diguanylate cyclase [Selenomonadaceae bacterium]
MIWNRREMEISKGIRAKLFLLFVTMGAIPFIILVTASAINTVAELEDAVKQNSLLRNAIISEHITELIEKNQVVLKSLAMSPNVIEYLQRPTDERKEYVLKILHDTDEIFDDNNMTALTGADGWQLIRTDGSTPVNLTKRQHFQEAMKGRTYVTDILTSMSTGEMIIVMEVPVLNAEGKPIGMLQRNFDLVVLEEYVQNLDDEEIYVVVMDRRGKIIVNSDNVVGVGSDYPADNNYKFILDRIYNSSGVIRIEVNGEDSLATYSRNLETGWMIVTIRPYHYIMDQVYDKAAKAVIFGLIMLFVGTLVAYLLTIRVTKPIIEMTNVVDGIISGKAPEENIKVSSDDELGQMAAAFNKIRSERDAYQLESELDKLTELFNKKTMENLCKMKLKTFNENENSNIFMAFYIIDLDHFKEVNDLLGHQFGDKVLVEFAKGLKKIFRPNDCIGRFGGDEFVVIVDSLPNMEVVVRKAEQIKQIAFNLAVEGRSRFVTASIGIAIAPQNGRDYDSLFAAADKAVYHVKNSGKNGYYCQLFAEENGDI